MTTAARTCFSRFCFVETYVERQNTTHQRSLTGLETSHDARRRERCRAHSTNVQEFVVDTLLDRNRETEDVRRPDNRFDQRASRSSSNLANSCSEKKKRTFRGDRGRMHEAGYVGCRVSCQRRRYIPYQLDRKNRNAVRRATVVDGADRVTSTAGNSPPEGLFSRGGCVTLAEFSPNQRWWERHAKAEGYLATFLRRFPLGSSIRIG